MMNIEAAARAMFDAFHARANRLRRWDTHPDDDGMEPGRDTFRDMARAVDALRRVVTVPAADEPAAAPVEPEPAPLADTEPT